MKRLSLTEGPILSSLFSLSVPIVLSNLLQSAYQITDTFWVGRLSAEAVAAVSISFPISFLLMAIGGGLPMAGAVLVSQYKGKGDDVAVNHTVAQTFLFIIGIAVLLTSIGYVSAEHIIRFMGAAPAVISDATLFLRVTFLGYLFVFMFFVFESLMRGFGEPKLPMKIVLATVLLNLVLDPLFIFGYGIIPPMGVAGAAMATFCTQALAALIGTLALLRGQYGMHIRLQDLRPDLLFFRQAFFLGLPSSIEQSTRALGMTVMTLLAASFGTMAVAAYGIGVRMLILVIIPALGLSIATSTFVGQNIGAGHIDRAERATRIGAGIGFLILSTCGVLLFFFARPLTLFFIPEGGEAVEMAVTFLKIVSPSFGFISIQMVINGTFRGAGLTTAAMMMAIISQWVFQFPLAYILAKHTNLAVIGLWWAFPLSNVFAAMVGIAWFTRGDWKKKNLLAEIELRRSVRDELVTEEGTVS
ncbi:MATE family efflux transporter [Candidatus Peribacteria bacterium]|nr:MATE family efflux transporter [Candidatus Peribacteria bacterium]